LTGSDPATRRLEELVDAAARGIGHQYRETIDLAAWRVAQLAILTIVLVSLYTGTFHWLRRTGRSATKVTESREP
jgi:hypothetical protein